MKRKIHFVWKWYMLINIFYTCINMHTNWRDTRSYHNITYNKEKKQEWNIYNPLAFWVSMKFVSKSVFCFMDKTETLVTNSCSSKWIAILGIRLISRWRHLIMWMNICATDIMVSTFRFSFWLINMWETFMISLVSWYCI